MGRGALQNLNEKFAAAVRHHAHGRFAEAETLCRHLLRAAPRFTEAMVLLAVTLCLEDRHDKRLQAIALLRRALALAPRDVQALDILGDALTAEGDQEGAIAVYRRAIAIDPSRARLYSKVGMALNDRGHHEAAIAAYRDALAPPERRRGLRQHRRSLHGRGPDRARDERLRGGDQGRSRLP
jgi:tetratricopeptide (TPR) repeat protein